MDLRRQQCITYAARHYPDWPKPASTWHTVYTHFGYHWTYTDFWSLENPVSCDVITEADVIAYRNRTQVRLARQIDDQFTLTITLADTAYEYRLDMPTLADLLSQRAALLEIDCNDNDEWTDYQQAFMTRLDDDDNNVFRFRIEGAERVITFDLTDVEFITLLTGQPIEVIRT